MSEIEDIPLTALEEKYIRIFNMWKSHDLWPWQWLTNGLVYIEHITAIEVMDRWYNDAQRMRTRSK